MPHLRDELLAQPRDERGEPGERRSRSRGRVRGEIVRLERGESFAPALLCQRELRRHAGEPPPANAAAPYYTERSPADRPRNYSTLAQSPEHLSCLRATEARIQNRRRSVAHNPIANAHEWPHEPPRRVFVASLRAPRLRAAPRGRGRASGARAPKARTGHRADATRNTRLKKALGMPEFMYKDYRHGAAKIFGVPALAREELT